MLGKMKKYKKIIVGAAGIFVALFVCYLIGQNIVLPSRMAKEGLLSYEGNMPEFSFIQNAKTLFYENQVQSTDYPGGQTVGLITIDGNEKAFLITPQTAIRYDLKLTKDMDKLSFVCGYHPAVEIGVADGANLTVEVISLAEETVLVQEKVEVMADGEEKAIEFDLSGFQGQEVRICISCDAGNAGDYSGDWIVFKNLVLE